MSNYYAITLIATMGGSAVLAAARRVIERRRARRELRSRPALGTTTSEGEVVRVTGIVRAGDEMLVAPLSSRRCVVYRARVDTSQWRMPYSKLSRMGVHEAIAMRPFVIERRDGSEVLIEGEHVALDLAPIKLGKDKDARERLLLRLGISRRFLRTAGFEEVLVEPGNVVSVAGLVMLDPLREPPADERGFRDAPAAALRIAGDLDHPLVIGTPLDPV